MKKLVLLLVVFALVDFLIEERTHAVNLLDNGVFEPVGGEVPDWMLDEFVTGVPNAGLDIAQNVTSATAQSPGRHLFNRPFVGGATVGPNNLTNSVLSQIQPVSAGQQYTFSGWSRFEANYAGGVATLSGGPLVGMPSPTKNTLILEYLDGSNSVIGSPFAIDVAADRIAQIGFPDPNDNAYYQHLVTATAPAGATKARVTAEARDMVYNGTGPAQSQFYDTFSLTEVGVGTELLLNPGLDTTPDTGLGSFTLVTDDPGNPTNVEVIRTAGFANRPASGGSRGVWLSSFFGEDVTPVDGTLSQTVAGTAGGMYTFTSWSKWEANFSGGQDILAGGVQAWMGQPSPTQMSVELAFLDSVGSVIGSPATLDLKAARKLACGGNANDTACGPAGDGWVESVVSATAPAGTVDVRVSGIMVDGISTGGGQSAFWDDFDLSLASTGTPGDFDGDGDVDGHDFLVWQRGGTTPPLDAGLLAQWQSNYAPLAAAVGAVPEPTTVTSFLIGLAALGFVRRR